MGQDDVEKFLDYQDPEDAHIVSELYVYRKALWGKQAICVFVGLSHIGLFSFLFLCVLSLSGLSISSLLMNVWFHTETVGILACLFGQIMLGVGLLISRMGFEVNPWASIQGGYWIMLLVLISLILSPCCLVAPVYLFMFLEVRECYVAAGFLKNKGFDLKNLPD